MITKKKKLDLEKQGYRLTGNHSSIKVCEWTKKSLRDEAICYKEKFYDTKCHLCVQMTPSVDVCTHRCLWCWRYIDHTKPKWQGKIDDPKVMVEECIKANAKYLEGFGGSKKTNFKKYKERLKPQQFAISLTGEPCMYPKLPALILELKKKKINSFLVTNGTQPTMLKKLIKAQPTQLYITLPAPDKTTYEKVCRPLIKNSWTKILKSLSLMSKFKRNVIRLTLVKDVNMIKPELYAKLIKKYQPRNVELKGYVHVGYSQKRLKKTNMPYHKEIKEFAKIICKQTNYKIIDEKLESKVVLLVRCEAL